MIFLLLCLNYFTQYNTKFIYVASNVIVFFFFMTEYYSTIYIYIYIFICIYVCVYIYLYIYIYIYIYVYIPDLYSGHPFLIFCLVFLPYEAAPIGPFKMCVIHLILFIAKKRKK